MKKEEVKLYANVMISNGSSYNKTVARICSDKIIDGWVSVHNDSLPHMVKKIHFQKWLIEPEWFNHNFCRFPLKELKLVPNQKTCIKCGSANSRLIIKDSGPGPAPDGKCWGCIDV